MRLIQFGYFKKIPMGKRKIKCKSLCGGATSLPKHVKKIGWFRKFCYLTPVLFCLSFYIILKFLLVVRKHNHKLKFYYLT